MLTAAYAHLGRLDEARTMLQRLIAFAPQTSIAGMMTVRARSDDRLDRLIEGMRKAGLT